jgi:hypothetical protein
LVTKNLKSMAWGAPIYRGFAPRSCATRIRLWRYLQSKFEPGFDWHLVDFQFAEEESYSVKSSRGRWVRHGLMLAAGPQKRMGKETGWVSWDGRSKWAGRSGRLGQGSRAARAEERGRPDRLGKKKEVGWELSSGGLGKRIYLFSFWTFYQMQISLNSNQTRIFEWF